MTDVVVFTVREDRLQVLLRRRGAEPLRGHWALPGGIPGVDEDLCRCARRELAEETGIADVYLEQLYTFGEPARYPRERVISVAYYALAPPHKLSARPPADTANAAWFPADALPPLAFDHGRIIGVARERLVAKLDYSTVAFQLLPAAFTLGELQRVYEILLSASLDKRNFRKWALALEQIEGTGKLRRRGRHRPARLYRLKNQDRVDLIR